MAKGLWRQAFEYGGHVGGLVDRRLHQYSNRGRPKPRVMALSSGKHRRTHRLRDAAHQRVSTRRVQPGIPDRERNRAIACRPSAPLFVSEYLEGPSFFAVTLIVIGVFLIGMFGNERSLGGRRAVLLSLATGVLIAAYTMIDGLGARAGSNAHAYVGWLLVLIAFPIIVLSKKRLNRNMKSLLAGHWQKGIPIGVLSALAYWVIVWAMTVAPMALVAAARETSILFAALVSWGVLREKVRPLRWAGVIVILIGLVLAKF